ncbi:MAG TPA: SHOCT domain-containing protein [Cyclobacteriaceae bacterium]|nr:SHOCT domain-containing protein [Cyclobacteriaceae bacterium]
MMYYYNGFSPFAFLGPIITILVWVCVAAIIIRIFAGPRHGRRRWLQDNTTPLDILKERYAKGEITKEQFDMMKQDLQ